MKILTLQTYNRQEMNPVFHAGGKPLGLAYIFEKRSYLLPQRVKNRVYTVLKNGKGEHLSLMQLHKDLYSPLLDCQTLEEAKNIFPEFETINDVVVKYQRRTINADSFTDDIRENFALKMLKEFWANLKTKDEIAKSFGMKNRTSLEWALKKIGFVTYSPNYKTLLMASDEAGNKLIAGKTRANNLENLEKMYAHNKKAAQACKTPEYRQAQSERMKKYDIEHPERRQKISEFDKMTWELCPEIKRAMNAFAEEQPAFVRSVVMKKIKGGVLSDCEQRIDKGFYKRFWQAHPELKEVLAKAKQKVREMKQNGEL